MAKIPVKTSQKTVPMIYAYTTPEIHRHDGWTKIGYTEQGVEQRMNQQTHTADVEYRLEWKGNAIYDDGSGEPFHDTDFHAYLRKSGIEQQKGTEWFHVTGSLSRTMFNEFRSTRGNIQSTGVVPYILRDEQKEAVEKAYNYFMAHENGQFLWNCKPRFGKTISVYDLCKKLDATNVLIVTNRPAIANSWLEDYTKFLGTESGYKFVSNVDALKGKNYVLTREEYVHQLVNEDSKCIEFVSLQDLKGSVYFGGSIDKLREVKDLTWDILVIDEAHEGVDTYKTDIAFDHIKRKYTLHLSGTPFKALANDKFPDEAIFNWTYADEQKKKREYVPAPGEDNPYAKLPQLNMFTYQMSEIIKDEVSKGIDLSGETEEYAFDLNEFFETKGTDDNPTFVHDADVDRFLDALTTQEKFPFSTPDLRNELKHTLWLLNRVASAKALAAKLKKHPVFKDYAIVLAAGDGRLSDEEEVQKSFDKVTEAIKNNDKTITLSVGQLTTGVTIPEWTAVLMLSGIKSPALYMQAAFRAQNPCMFVNGNEYLRKQNAYIFDFDPARTLILYEEIANDLSEDTSGGKGDSDTRKQHVRELLNFFPVLGEDEDGEMIPLDAEKVLSIPRKLKSQEVVRRGFMSNFLFQNIGVVFSAPQEVINIINNMEPIKEPKEPLGVTPQTAEELSLDKNGDVALDPGYVIGTASDLFGEKIYDTDEIEEKLDDAVEKAKAADTDKKKENELLDGLIDTFHTNVTNTVIREAKETYGRDLSPSGRKQMERKINANTDSAVNRVVGDFQIRKKTIEQERQKELAAAVSSDDETQINARYDQKIGEAAADLKQQLSDTVDTAIKDAGRTVVETVESEKREQKKKGLEDDIKDHLRGFSRTIPSFLMAYGDENTTLTTFDKIVPDDVFQKVTSITLDQFRFLRDGGDFVNKETGQTDHFAGHLFDPVVFDDSCREFLSLKKKLADYFDDSQKEDIFDYVPPQRTNQIYTPKAVVKDMVDRLQKENPGCYDDPDNTFIDLYMKSGLYITEIVKRLYNSPKIKSLYPDNTERLNHIFAKQVFGLAPTEIIYRISTNFILGFSDEIHIEKNNLRLCDALPYAKAGTLGAKLNELFPDR